MPIMKDGYSTLITLTGNLAAAGVVFKEKRVKPPGMDAGGKIDTTSMRNTQYRTSEGKSLVTFTDSSIVVEWDPDCYPVIFDLIGSKQEITWTFPNGETLSLMGSIDKFEPNEQVEGEQPTANMTIIFHNTDANGNEVGIVLYTGVP